jgi:hypothetical protein
VIQGSDGSHFDRSLKKMAKWPYRTGGRGRRRKPFSVSDKRGRRLFSRYSKKNMVLPISI